MKIFAEDVCIILKCLFICSDGILKIKNSPYVTIDQVVTLQNCQLQSIYRRQNLYVSHAELNKRNSISDI